MVFFYQLNFHYCYSCNGVKQSLEPSPSVTVVLTCSDKPCSNTRVDEHSGQQPLQFNDYRNTVQKLALHIPIKVGKANFKVPIRLFFILFPPLWIYSHLLSYSSVQPEFEQKAGVHNMTGYTVAGAINRKSSTLILLSLIESSFPKSKFLSPWKPKNSNNTSKITQDTHL